MLILRAFCICDDEHIDLEPAHLCNVFQMNGYSSKQIMKVIKDTKTLIVSQSKPQKKHYAHRVPLPFINGISHKISKILANKGIHNTFKPFSVVKHRIHSLKEPKDLLMELRVYKIECSCGVQYIG